MGGCVAGSGPEDAEDVGRFGGLEGDVVAAVFPVVDDVGEEVLNVEGACVRKIERVQVEIQPSTLLCGGIQVDDREDGVGAICGGLGIS